MKFLLFLLLPALSFAQNINYPDSLTILSGKTYPCYVKNVDESSVEIIYLNNIPSKGKLQSIKNLTLEKLGTVYQDGKGLLLSLDTVQAFLSERQKEHPFVFNLNKPEQEALAPKGKVAPAAEQITETDDLPPDSKVTTGSKVNTAESQEGVNRWSFGILYVPYYSGELYNIYQSSSSYPLEIYSTLINTSVTEAEFSYLTVPKLRLTLNVRYTSAINDDRTENHSRDQIYNNNTDNGTNISKKMNLFNFDLGVKYYFADLFSQRTSAYILAGIGKQFASASSKTENLFQTNPAPVPENNQDEFLTDLNSPFHLFAGFGAEYSFNDYLSLFSNIRFYYSSIKASYDYRLVTASTSQTRTRDYKNSEANTYVAVGLNFYF